MIKKSYLLLTILVLFVLLFVFSIREIISPFVLAFTIAYIFRPFVAFLERKKVGKTLPALIVTLVFTSLVCGLIFFVVPFLSRRAIEFFKSIQIASMANSINASIKGFIHSSFPSIKSDEIFDVEQIFQFVAGKFSVVIQDFVLNAAESVFRSINDIAILMLTPVILYHLIKEWDSMTSGFYALVPKRFLGYVGSASKEMHAGLYSYLIAQIKLSCILAAMYALMLYFTKLEHGVMIGLLIGLLSFVPYVGFAIMSITTVLISLNEFASDLSAVRNVILVLAIGQTLDVAIINPKIMGENLQLNPVWIIFGVLSCSLIFGVFGAFFAMPILVVAKIVIKHFIREYRSTKLF